MHTPRAALVVLGLLATSPALAGKKADLALIATVTGASERIWNAHDLSAIDAAYSPDLAATTKETASAMLAIYPDAHMTIDDAFVSGDRVVSAWTFRGTNLTFGRPIEVQGLSVERVVEGVIVESTNRFDQLAIWTQLGVDPFEVQADGYLRAARDFADLAYNSKDLDLAFSLVVPGGYPEHLNDAPAVPHTRESHEAAAAQWTDARLTVDNAFARGDRVHLAWSFTGTHLASGRRATIGGSWVARFEDGLIAEVWNTYDTAPITALLTPPEPEPEPVADEPEGGGQK